MDWPIATAPALKFASLDVNIRCIAAIGHTVGFKILDTCCNTPSLCIALHRTASQSSHPPHSLCVKVNLKVHQVRAIVPHMSSARLAALRCRRGLRGRPVTQLNLICITQRNTERAGQKIAANRRGWRHKKKGVTEHATMVWDSTNPNTRLLLASHQFGRGAPSAGS